MEAFYVSYRPIEGGDDQQILVIARDLMQALNASVVESAGRQIVKVSMVECPILFACDEGQ